MQRKKLFAHAQRICKFGDDRMKDMLLVIAVSKSSTAQSVDGLERHTRGDENFRENLVELSMVHDQFLAHQHNDCGGIFNFVRMAS